MRRTAAWGLALLFAAAVATGCSASSSDLVATDDIEAHFVVTGQGDEIVVGASLRKNLSTDVELVKDDRIVASWKRKTVELESTDIYDGPFDIIPIGYEGELEVKAKPGREVSVALERGEESDAPTSVVTLPARVTITAPVTGDPFDRRKTLTFALDDADGVRIEWEGSCVVDGANESGEVVPAGAVKRIEDGSDTCPVTFTVIREVAGDLDDAYEKGSIVARQQASVDLLIRGREAVVGTPPSQAAESPAFQPQPGAPTASDERPFYLNLSVWMLLLISGAFVIAYRRLR